MTSSWLDTGEPRLRPVTMKLGMKCTETAICAITGLPVEEVNAAIDAAIKKGGRSRDPNGAVNMNDTVEALRNLGFKCDSKLDSKDTPLSIQNFVRSNSYDLAYLGGASRTVNDKKEWHLFAGGEATLFRF